MCVGTIYGVDLCVASVVQSETVTLMKDDKGTQTTFGAIDRPQYVSAPACVLVKNVCFAVAAIICRDTHIFALQGHEGTVTSLAHTLDGCTVTPPLQSTRFCMIQMAVLSLNLCSFGVRAHDRYRSYTCRISHGCSCLRVCLVTAIL
jgi:hypothetical protein